MRVVKEAFLKIKLRAASVLLGLLLIQMSPVTLADGVKLSISPERCFGLDQGQKCYQKITVNWQLDKEDKYCLYQTTSKSPMVCWEPGTKGQAKLEFESSETVIYQLRLESTGESIAETRIIVTWVYGKTKRRRTSWRLF